jgi:hypothetical protein
LGFSSKSVLFAALLATVVFATVAQAPALGSASGYIDPGLFASTVPPAMTLGQGYQVKVYLTNNGTHDLNGIVVLAFPQQYFFSDKAAQLVALPPGDAKLFDFNLVAANPHVGKMTVSASLFITNGAIPFQNASVTTTVYSIDRSPVVSQAAFDVVVGLLAIAGLYALSLLLGISRKRGGSISSMVR